MNTDTEAVTYLQLANDLIREARPDAITIAEDMSGMPGMCDRVADGGIGFDDRLAMGLPDLWIRLIKERRDEDWSLEHIWHELTAQWHCTSCCVCFGRDATRLPMSAADWCLRSISIHDAPVRI